MAKLHFFGSHKENCHFSSIFSRIFIHFLEDFGKKMSASSSNRMDAVLARLTERRGTPTSCAAQAATVALVAEVATASECMDDGDNGEVEATTEETNAKTPSDESRASKSVSGGPN